MKKELQFTLLLVFMLFQIQTGTSQVDFQWARHSGGNSRELGKAVAFDHYGNVIIAGEFNGTTNFGDFAFTTFGGTDIFIAKYSPTGEPLWAQQAGGPEYQVWEGTTPGEWISGVVVDEQNDIIVCGRLQGEVTFGPFTVSSDDQDWPDVFVAKYAPDGTIKWVQTYGGYEWEVPYGLDVDAAGNIYIIGTFYLETEFGPFTFEPISSPDMFLLKLGPAGDVLWAKPIYGIDYEQPYSLTLDPSGNIIMCGGFTSDITFGTTTLISQGSYDIFLAKLDPDGNSIWARRAGGSEFDCAQAITCGENGEIWVTGFFKGTADFQDQQRVALGDQDVFIAQYSSDGNLQWIKTGNGPGREESRGICLDPKGNCLVAGNYNATIQFDDFLLTSQAGSDIFLVQYDAQGKCRWATSLNGLNSDAAYGIAQRTSRSAVITGSFRENLRLGDLLLESPNSENHYFLSKFSLESPEPFLRITKPNNGEVWVAGTHYPIFWESDIYEGDVKIELSTNSGEKWRVMSISENDGRRHIRPGLGDVSTHCLIRISLVDDESIQDVTDREFTIIGPADSKHYFANEIPATIDLPLIDGDLSDLAWNFARAPESLKVGDQVYDFLKPWVDFDDNSVTWQSLWSAGTNRLYLAVKVQDDVAGAIDHPVDRLYNDDTIELFTDGNLDGGFYTGAYNSAQHWLIRKDNQKKLANLTGEYTGSAIISATQSGENGNWTLEAELTIFTNYPNAEKTLSAGDSIGWDIWYDDSDNNESFAGKYIREHQVGWGYVGPAWENAFTFQKIYLAPVPFMTFSFDFPQPGWYLVSLPVAPINNQLCQLFPSALAAFAYNPVTRAYEPVTELQPRQGYWVLIPEPAIFEVSGDWIRQYTGTYEMGWHLVGAPFEQIDFQNPLDTPDNSVLAAFSWQTIARKYEPVFPAGTGVLNPGKGYWIAVIQPCDIFYGKNGESANLVHGPETVKFADEFGVYPPDPPFFTEVATGNFIPLENRLSSNFPNPFNPSTTIEFSLRSSGQARLFVHNSLGQRVCTLLEGILPAGTHQVNWDARNEAGQIVPSGLYFYTIETSDWRETRKMLLMK